MMLTDSIRINIPPGLVVVCSRCGNHFALEPKQLGLGAVRKICACCGGEISSRADALYKLYARTTDTGMELLCTHYRCAKDCEDKLLSDGYLPVDAH